MLKLSIFFEPEANFVHSNLSAEVLCAHIQLLISTLFHIILALYIALFNTEIQRKFVIIDYTDIWL